MQHAHGSQAYLWVNFNEISDGFSTTPLEDEVTFEMGMGKRGFYVGASSCGYILYSFHLRETVEASFCNHTLKNWDDFVFTYAVEDAVEDA